MNAADLSRRAADIMAHECAWISRSLREGDDAPAREFLSEVAEATDYPVVAGVAAVALGNLATMTRQQRIDTADEFAELAEDFREAAS